MKSAKSGLNKCSASKTDCLHAPVTAGYVTAGYVKPDEGSLSALYVSFQP